MARRLLQIVKATSFNGGCSSYVADVFGPSAQSIGLKRDFCVAYVTSQPMRVFGGGHTSCVPIPSSLLRKQCGYDCHGGYFRTSRAVDHGRDQDMRHLFISAPIVALGLSVALFIVGASWWWISCAFFLTAPALIGLAVLLCNTVLPCSGRDSED